MEYRLLQIMPALPGTYALRKEEGRFTRDPVPAWGLWEETDKGVVSRAAGPLVVCDGRLEPAEMVAQNFVGVRIGDCVTDFDSIRFDDETALFDPAKPL